MHVLILFSTTRTDDFRNLEIGLGQSNISLQGMPFSQHWKLADAAETLAQLKKCTHYLFLVSREDLQHPLFLFSCGYCLALAERSFIWDPDNLGFPDSWKEALPVTMALDELLVVLSTEKTRWQNALVRMQAKELLVDRGFDVTPTALAETVEKGEVSSVELFLKAGFDVNSSNRKGVTLLGLAIRFNHLNVVRMLLSWGADINLKSRDRDNTPLMDAAAEGHLEMLQELIHLGADLAGQSRNGQNALVLAIGKGADAVCRILLDAGADPFMDDKLGMSALKYAQMFGRKDIVGRIAELYPDKA